MMNVNNMLFFKLSALIIKVILQTLNVLCNYQVVTMGINKFLASELPSRKNTFESQQSNIIATSFDVNLLSFNMFLPARYFKPNQFGHFESQQKSIVGIYNNSYTSEENVLMVEIILLT